MNLRYPLKILGIFFKCFLNTLLGEGQVGVGNISL
jgi:hypothetical protein